MINEKTKEEIRELPPPPTDFEINLIDQDDKVPLVVDFLQSNPVIGFDLEHPPIFKAGDYKPATLIQLANDDQVFLVQIEKLENKKILLNRIKKESNKKIGLALHDDLRYFQPLNKKERESYIDLAKIAQNAGYQRCGLRNLTGSILGYYISKSQQVSNWGANVLSEAQMRYASLDAWLPLKLYRAMKEQEII